MPRSSVAVVAALVLLVPAVPAHGEDPSPATHWFTRINTTHVAPTGMTVVVVPPAYASEEAMVDDASWVGTDALLEAPGTRAALEATAYWAWMIDRYEAEYPSLAHLTYATKVLGVDATVADLRDADIVVLTAMAADPFPFLFHAGVGLPTYPARAFWSGEDGQRVCTVVNSGLGQATTTGPWEDAKRAHNEVNPYVEFVPGESDDESPTRLRNLVLHEFGHCLGAGHLGESLGLPHDNHHGVVYDDHPTDVLSVAFGHVRQCLSNANMLSLAEGYAWTVGSGEWQPHDAEAYMPKSDYVQVCVPDALKTY